MSRDPYFDVPPTRVVPVHGTRAGEPAPERRMRLGEALVAAGVITEAQLGACLQRQEGRHPKPRLGAIVVELGLATDIDVARGLATILGFDFVDPAAVDVPLEVIRTLPRATAQRIGAVPLAAGPTWVKVAVADPTDRDMLAAVREATGLLNVSLAVATPRAIAAALDRFWSPGYAPAPATTAAAPPETEPEPETGGWEYAFVGDGVPPGHPGHTADLADTERALGTLGAAGWEVAGLHANAGRVVVLLKRRT